MSGISNISEGGFIWSLGMSMKPRVSEVLRECVLLTPFFFCVAIAKTAESQTHGGMAKSSLPHIGLMEKCHSSSSCVDCVYNMYTIAFSPSCSENDD